MPIVLMVLALVFIPIAIRQAGRIMPRIWQVMLGGIVVVLATGAISPAAGAWEPVPRCMPGQSEKI